MRDRYCWLSVLLSFVLVGQLSAIGYQEAGPRQADHGFDGLMSPAALGITRVLIDVGRGKLAFSR